MSDTSKMSFTYRRAYTGRLQGVILDWAGTTVDYGCFAPTVVFLKMFEEQGVPITMAEARAPMGKYKRDHIAEIARMPAVAARWQEAHGRLPNDDDVQAMFEAFIPRQIEAIARYADLIPGVNAAVEAFRARGLKVGTCTGYTRAMMTPLLAEARRQGYEPDSVVCPDDVRGGRPAPWMCFQNAMNLNIHPMEAMIKIGDTIADIEEGLNAGMWTIGLAKTGNELGMSEREVAALAPDALREKLNRVAGKLYGAGAHYVVDSLADALPVLAAVEERLARGEKP